MADGGAPVHPAPGAADDGPEKVPHDPVDARLRAGAGQRTVLGVVAVVLLAAAVSILPDAPVVGVLAGLGALLAAVMTVTGRCPEPPRRR